jgi:hypothetical protein
MTEMARRADMVKEGSLYDQANPDKISQRGYNPLMFGSDKKGEAHP